MGKPIIGLGTDIVGSDSGRDRAFVYLNYVEAVRRAGGIPLLIPPQPENLDALLEEVDGVLLAGGDDCDPAAYGEEKHSSCELMDARRQTNDLEIARLSRQHHVPTLGICLGVQVMTVAAGGSLIQDIGSQVGDAINHVSPPSNRARHDVRIERGTVLDSILGESELSVNSSHHQAIRTAPAGLTITAYAPDGIIEGIEDPSHPFYIGVQWHPEDMTGEGSASKLFEAFISAARERHLSRERRNELATDRTGAE